MEDDRPGPETASADAGQHEGAHPESGQPPGGHPGIGYSEIGQSEVAQSEVAQSEVGHRESGSTDSGPAGDEHLGAVALLSTSDTDLLAARASGADYRLANPARLPLDDLPALLAGTDVVVVRLLGGEQAWREGLAQLRAQPRPLIVLGGELAPDAALMALSTVPAGIAAQAHEYLAHGGTANLLELARFLTDTVLLGGTGFAAPRPAPPWGIRPWPGAGIPSATAAQPGTQPGPASEAAAGPTVGIIYYRAHELAGNTAFIDALCEAVAARGARPLPVWCASLRSADDGLLDVLRQADTLVVTVLAAGGITPALSQAGGDDESWDVGAIAGLDVPVAPGAVPDLAAGSVGAGQHGTQPAGRGHPGGHPGVRRPADQRAVLVQGDRRRRPAPLCR